PQRLRPVQRRWRGWRLVAHHGGLKMPGRTYTKRSSPPPPTKTSDARTFASSHRDLLVKLAPEAVGQVRHPLYLRHLYQRGMQAQDIDQADLERVVSAANVALQIAAGAPRTNGVAIFNGRTPQFDSATVTMELVDAALSGA